MTRITARAARARPTKTLAREESVANANLIAQ